MHPTDFEAGPKTSRQACFRLEDVLEVLPWTEVWRSTGARTRRKVNPVRDLGRNVKHEYCVSQL